MMTPGLLQAIVEFREIVEFRRWHTQAGAQAECSNASYSFQGYLLGKGIEAKIRPLIGLPRYVARARLARDTPDELHVIVEVGETIGDNAVYIDWTRRQYQPRAAYPVITTKQELESEGWRLATMQEGFDWSTAVHRQGKQKRAQEKIARDRAARGE